VTRPRPRRVAVVLLVLGVSADLFAQSKNWPSERPPQPLAEHSVKFPPYQVKTLANGLQVIAVSHHEQPAVSLRLIVRAGAAQDPVGRPGVAELAAALLDQGTTTKSAEQIANAIDSIGGALGTGAETDLSYINVVVMKDSLGVGLDLVSDLAQHPSFANEEIERQRQQALSGLRVSYEDPEFLANVVFDRLVYGLHPYGRPQSGTPETLSAITRDDLLAFHRTWFGANNAILAIVGDVTADEAFDGVKKVFGDWERRDVAGPEFVAPPDPTRRVIVVDKPDAVQTEVRVGHIGVKRSTADYMPLNMTVRILGGEGANRLHQVLRAERSLTYGAKASMDTLLESGDFEASTNTRSEATGEVLRLIVDEFWRLQRERVSERELSGAKAYMTGSFPLTIETPDAIATQVLNVLFYGLPVEQLQTFRSRVNAVTPDDIERSARTYLKPDRLSVVLVGNAKAFVSQLKALGFTSYEVIEMNDLDLMAADFRRAADGRAAGGGASRPAGPGGRTTGQPGGATPRYVGPDSQSTQSTLIAPRDALRLVERVIAAKGGMERLRAIKNITATTKAIGLGPNAPQGTVETVTYLEYPNHVRVESKTPRGETVQVFDGSRAWVKDPAGTHDVPDQMVRDLEANLRRDTVAALLAAADGRLNARQLLDAKDQNGALRYAMELSGPDLDPTILYIDPESGLVVKQSYVAGGRGTPLVEEIFSDYRMVDGVQVAFSTTVRIRGESVLDRRVAAFTINAPISPALFKRPTS